MANKFITIQEIARSALPILRNNLIFPALAYTDFSNDFSKKGDTVQVKKPPVYVADEFSSTISVQDVKEESVLVKLDKIADVSVTLTAKEMALNLEDFSKQVIEPAAVALAEKINADGLSLYKDIPYHCGQAGSAPSTIDVFAEASKILNDNKAPINKRSAVWNSEALLNFQKIPAIINAEKSGSTRALREGSVGRIIGLDNYMSQQVCRHTSGGLAPSASGNLAVSVAATAGTDMLIVKSSASGGITGTLVPGDLLKIGGNSYTVTELLSRDSAVVSVRIYPAMKKTAPVGEQVTLVPSHAANLAFHKNAFGFVTRPLERARGAESYVTSFGGLTLRVTMGYDMTTKKQTLSIDTLYGFKTLYPELAVRILG